MFRSNWTILRKPVLSLAKATILWNWSVKVHCYMICDSTTLHYTARSTHITVWNTCCHNAAYHITMYFHWSIPQYCSFSKAQHTLSEDGPIGRKHVGANKEIFQLYVLTFYVFNKRVHLLVKRILRRFWVSYILFIIIIGGILVLFVYITRLASNEIFSSWNKIKIAK
jgi:hypothetical protein